MCLGVAFFQVAKKQNLHLLRHHYPFPVMREYFLNVIMSGHYIVSFLQVKHSG